MGEGPGTPWPFRRGHCNGVTIELLCKTYMSEFQCRFASRFLKSKRIISKFKDLYMPSTGALMLLTALHACDQVSGLLSGIHSSRVQV